MSFTNTQHTFTSLSFSQVHGAAYERLLRELKVYRERTAKLLDEQKVGLCWQSLKRNSWFIACGHQERLRIQEERIRELEEENVNGQPGERRFIELAALQVCTAIIFF